MSSCLCCATSTAGTPCRSRIRHRALNYGRHERDRFQPLLPAALVSKVHFRRAPGKPLPAQRQRADAAWSKVRSAVKHVFATQKHRMGLFIGTIGIERARAKIGLANIAFNFKRFPYWENRPGTT